MPIFGTLLTIIGFTRLPLHFHPGHSIEYIVEEFSCTVFKEAKKSINQWEAADIPLVTFL